MARSLFTLPRRVELGPGQASATIRSEVIDASLPSQGFELELSADGVRVRAADALGLRYTRSTIRSLDDASELRAGTIADWPDFTNRAYMLDVSRDRVPTNETLAWLVEVLASLRYTQLQLYVEHTYAYEGHDDVWRDASPLTPDDLRWLDRMCADHGVELVANLNTFGHMDRWLRHDRYRSMAECPEGSRSVLGSRRMPPWSLEPTEANAAFARSLAVDMLASVTSRTVNIGADEPFDLGSGRSAAAVAERGRASVYLDQLRRITDPLIAAGFHVQFWGDVLRRHPELVAQLPPTGATALVWNYEAPSPDGPSLVDVLGRDTLELMGMPDDAHLGFRSHVRSYAKTGYPFWVAAGTSTWNTLLGRWTNARANLLDAARVGLDTGARGFMVTDWGDNGHHHPMPISIPALVYGAAVSWNVDAYEHLDVGPVVDAVLDAEPGIGGLLIELGCLYDRIGLRTINGSAIAMALYPSPPLPVFGTADAAGIDRALELLDAAVERFASVPFHGVRAATVAQELHSVAFLARHALHRLQQRVGATAPDGAALDAEWHEAVERQHASWLASSRPGGLDDSIGRIGPPSTAP